MNKKKLACTAMAACMALSCAAGTAGAVEISRDNNSAVVEGNEISPRAGEILNVQNVVPDVGTPGSYVSASRKATGEYWKLWVENHSDEAMVATLHEDNENGAVVGTLRLPANSNSFTNFDYEGKKVEKDRYYCVVLQSGADISGSRIVLKTGTSTAGMYSLLSDVES